VGQPAHTVVLAHLIVAHEVTNVGIDKGHLTIKALADRGYFKSEEIVACEEAGIEVYVPRPLTSNARAESRYDRRDFV
jgi:transposase